MSQRIETFKKIECRADIEKLVKGMILYQFPLRGSPAEKINLNENPLKSNELAGFRVIALPMTNLTLKATEAIELSRTKSRKCKNMFALGLLYWLYDRPLQPTMRWIETRYPKEKAVVEANQAALKAGYDYAITTEIFNEYYTVPPAQFEKGKYKQITGNLALSLGCVAASYCTQLYL